MEQILLFDKFFSDCRYMSFLVAKIQSVKVVRWCPDGDILAIFGSYISSERGAAHFRPAF